MKTRKARAKVIILSYAVAHASVAAILANTVIGDAPVLMALTTLMVYQLAKLCEQKLDKAVIASTAANLFGSVCGTYLAAKFITWLPFVGNGINAAITFTMSQVIGWAAFAMFDDGMSQAEAIKYGESQKMSKEEMQILEDSMSYADKIRFIYLKKQFQNFKLSDDEREEFATEMEEIIDRYTTNFV